MKLNPIFNKTIVITISLVFLTLSVIPVNAMADPRRSNGYSFKQVPPGSHRVRHGKGHYVVHNGRFYKPGHGGYIHTRPSRGVVVTGLPLAATLLVMAGITYYVFEDIYYRKTPSGYQVVEVPRAASIGPGARVSVLANALNVRSGPGLNHPEQSRVYYGDMLTVQASEADWVYVRLPDRSFGWVMTCFVSILDNGAKG